MESGATGPINLGKLTDVAMIELANNFLVHTKTGTAGRFIEIPPDDPKLRKPEISEAARLGWESRFELDVGLTEAVSHFSQNPVKLPQTRFGIEIHLRPFFFRELDLTLWTA